MRLYRVQTRQENRNGNDIEKICESLEERRHRHHHLAILNIEDQVSMNGDGASQVPSSFTCGLWTVDQLAPMPHRGGLWTFFDVHACNLRIFVGVLNEA